MPPASPSINYAEWLFLNLVENVEEYAIFAMNTEGHIVHWNKGATNITGYEEADVLGGNLVARVNVENELVGGAVVAVGPGHLLANGGSVASDVEAHVEVVAGQPGGQVPRPSGQGQSHHRRGYE